MENLFNFHNTGIIFQYNWWLIIIALAFGIWIGWSTTTSTHMHITNDKRGEE